MKKNINPPYVINSISGLHQVLALTKPEHPMISVIRYEDIKAKADTIAGSIISYFYLIAIKKGFKER